MVIGVLEYRIWEKMKNRISRVAIGIVFFVLILGFVFFVITKLNDNKKYSEVIASNFVGYDFARAVSGEQLDISMLMKPGAEMHDFEPTPEDIIKIKNADLFIYVGGESDEWVIRLLQDNEIPKEKTLRLMDLVEVKKEELSEGMEDQGHHDEENQHDEGHDESSEHEHTHQHEEDEAEYDEHVWTSIPNAIKMINGIRDKLIDIHPESKDIYIENTKNYIARLSDIDRRIREVVASGNKKELIFGDRFPFRYLVDEYGLDYYAAFPGCSEQTEASSQTIAFLIDKAKKDNIKIILKTELTADKLAQTIADEVGAKVMTLNAAHNIAQEDFDKGVTYADIMEENIDVLREALK